MLPFNREILERDPFPVLQPNLQINFYQLLKVAENELLMPALLDHVSNLDITVLDKELSNYAGREKLQYLAKFGLRGELVFPVPYVLRGKPQLLGYYRLLLGFSQKELGGKPFGPFLTMEKNGTLSRKVEADLPKLCISFVESSWILINNIPDLSKDILNALSMLTYGAQLRGSRNTALGKSATKSIFDLISNNLKHYIVNQDKGTISIVNSNKEKVMIDFSFDPDISIYKILPNSKLENISAVEIKGGQDYSNVHNRIGEAEKSHQKAKSRNYKKFITIVNVDKLDFEKAKLESPTTDHFFLFKDILNYDNPEYKRFIEILLNILEIKK